jgi:hypothetical protein
MNQETNTGPPIYKAMLTTKPKMFISIQIYLKNPHRVPEIYSTHFGNQWINISHHKLGSHILT